MGEAGDGAARSTGDSDDSFRQCLHFETERIEQRRGALGIDQGLPRTGLALSGGGIRSATFSLGVLQALSEHGWLRRMDYLSTVSGGSYIGSFLGALYVRPARRGEDGLPADRTGFNDHPLQTEAGVEAVKQLREAGRYLTPRGTSDAFFGASVVLRNWAAVQIVIGALAFALFWLVHLVDRSPHVGALLSLFMPEPAARTKAPTAAACAPAAVAEPPCAAAHVTEAAAATAGAASAFNGLLVAALFLSVLVFLAFGTSYWLTRREWIDTSRVKRATTNLFFWLLVVLTLLFAYSGLKYGIGLLGFGAVMLVLAIAFYALGEWKVGKAPNDRNNPDLLIAAEDHVRTFLSRWMSRALMVLLAVAGLILVDAIGFKIKQTVPFMIDGLSNIDGFWSTLKTLVTTYWPVLSAVAPVIMTVASNFALRSGDPNSFIAKFSLRSPLGLTLAGLLVLGSWLALWSAAAQAALDSALGLPAPVIPGTSPHLNWMLPTLALLGVNLVLGYAYSFINLSSLSTFYASRLRRAYIGASNPRRRKLFGSDRNLRGDHIPLRIYYDPANLAPQHLINVTIAETQAAESNIIARDRKGKPMHISPGGVVFAGTMPGTSACLLSKGWTDFKLNTGEELPLSNWVAISGAAVSSAIGSGTSLGGSLLATMANVRLGYWWKHEGSRSRMPELWDVVQKYLLRELRGAFTGTRDLRWYLTDGGHFDNTGVYVLLQRRLDYIVMSDNGADPDYVFDDVVRLVNRAQNDLGVRIGFVGKDELDLLIDDRDLRSCFGAYRDLARKPLESDELKPFAALARITYPAEGELPEKSAWLLVIKPRLTFAEPPELLAYYQRSGTPPTFPQQSTGDQFFDEDQWEAYRRLGEIIGDRLFRPPGSTPADTWWPTKDL